MQYHLKNLEIQAWLGVYESEKQAPQRLVANVWFEAPAAVGSASDNLNDVVDYAAVEQLVRNFAGKTHYHLLERLQAELLKALKTAFPQLQSLRLSLEKFPFQNGSVVVS